MPESQAFQPIKTSPLDGLPGAHGGVILTERRFIGKVNLRGNTENTAFMNAVHEVVGCHPPTEPNTVATAGELTVFWLGPDEWQIHCPENGQHAMVETLRKALDGQHKAVVDVSDYYVVMRLSGAKVLEVLSKGTSLDLHPRVFAPGRCAQTVFGHATVLIHKVEDQVVDLQVRWSFAEYLWSFIVDGTLEYSGTSS